MSICLNIKLHLCLQILFLNRNSILLQWSLLLLCIVICGFIPVVSAAPDQDPFPDIPFHVFSDFIQSQFSSQVSLATVMAILMTMTSNRDLLNLHPCQQHPKVGNEGRPLATGCIKALARALENRLGDTAVSLFREVDHKSQLSADQ